MADKKKKNEIADSQAAKAIVEFVQKRFKNWKKNREPLEKKWEQNREDALQLFGKKGKKGEGDDWRSKTVSGATRRKMASAFSVVLDMFLQGGKIPFLIKASAELEQMMDEQMDELQREELERSIKTAKKRIEDQLVKCHADQVLTKNVMAGALYGVTYAKGTVRTYTRDGRRLMPIEGVEDTRGISLQDRVWERYEYSETAPAVEYVSCWNIFRDYEEPLESGSGYIHRRLVSPYWLRQYIDKPYYFTDGIERAIKLAREKKTGKTNDDDSSLPPYLRDMDNRQNNITHLEFRGRMPRVLVERFVEAQKGKDEDFRPDPEIAEFDGDEVEVICTVSDDELTRFVLSTPKDRLLWEVLWDENVDELGGRGVADNCEQVNHVLTKMLRALEDNTTLATAFIVALKERLLENPEDINAGLKNGVLKLLLSDDCEDASRAVQQVSFRSIAEQILPVIQLFEEYADEDSMIPAIQHGGERSGDTTAYELSLQSEKSGKYLGAVIRNYDNDLIEPEISYCNDYNQDDPDFPEGQGDFVVVPLGFTSYQERTERMRRLQTMFQLITQSPELQAKFKLDEIVVEMMKALDTDEEQFKRSDDEVAALMRNQQQAQEPAPDPGQQQKTMAEIEKLRAETEAKRMDMEVQAAKVETDMAKAEAELSAA